MRAVPVRDSCTALQKFLATTGKELPVSKFLLKLVQFHKVMHVRKLLLLTNN